MDEQAALQAIDSALADYREALGFRNRSGSAASVALVRMARAQLIESVSELPE